MNETKSKLKDSYSNYVRKKEILLEKENIQLESKSLQSQVESIRKSLTGISEAEQEIIAKKANYEIEDTIVNKSVKELELFEGKADELIELLANYPEEIGDTTNLENNQLIKEITDEVKIKFDEIKAAADTLKKVFSDESLSKLSENIIKWQQVKDKFEASYKTAKENSKASVSQLTDIQKLEDRITEINGISSERDSILKEIGNPEEVYNSLRDRWNVLHQEKIGSSY